MTRHPIREVITRLLIPYLLLFALYVQFHGDYGPGGGFQAGVIFAAALILYALVFDPERTYRVAPPRVLRALTAIGVLIYAGVGLTSLLRGGHFLDDSVLRTDPIAGQHLGIVLVELGVGITVASVLLLIYLAFAGRTRP